MSDRTGIVGAIQDFGSGFKDSALQPVEGLLELSGIHKPEKEAATDAEAQAPGKMYSAGAMVGQAFDFTALSILAKKIPGLSEIEGLRQAPAVLAAGGLGFLSANEVGKNSLNDRFESAAVGAATIGVLDGSTFALGKMGLKDSIGDKLIKTAVSGAVTGALTTQVSEKLKTGHWASVSETAGGATSWAATGVVLGGVSEYVGQRGRAVVKIKTELLSQNRLAPTSSGTFTLDPPSERTTIPLIVSDTIAPPVVAPKSPIDASSIAKLHPALPPEHTILLANVMNSIVEGETESNSPGVSQHLLNDKFDPHAYLQIYQRLLPTSDHYAVLGMPKEEWLSKMSMRIARTFGSDANKWLDKQEDFKKVSTGLGEYELGAISQRASWLPLPESHTGEAIKSLLLRDNSFSTAQLEQLSRQGKANPAALDWLVARGDQNINDVSRVWTQLPKLPAPLALKFANTQPLERLTAELAWSNTVGQLSSTERQLIETSNYDPEKLTKFSIEYHRLIAEGTTSVLEQANNVAFTVKELFPDLSPTQARQLAEGATGAAGKEGENASRLLSSGFDTTQFFAALSKLNGKGTQTIDIRSLYNKEARAFELVQVLGSDWSEWLDRHLQADGKPRDPANFASLRLPTAFAGEPFHKFLMNNPELSLKDITVLAKGLEHVPSTVQADIWQQSKLPSPPETNGVIEGGRTPGGVDISIKNAIRAWEIEARLPWAIASHFGGMRSVENGAAIVAFRELASIHSEEPQRDVTIHLRDIPTRVVQLPPTEANISASAQESAQAQSMEQVAEGPQTTMQPEVTDLSARKLAERSDLSDPEFTAFKERYDVVLARGKYKIIADLNSLSLAIGIFHPSLSRIEATYMEQAARSAEGRHNDTLSLVHANVKAGTFAKVLRKIAQTDKLSDDLTWQASSALAATNIFGRDANQWLSLQQSKGLEFHDATQWLPIYSPKEAAGLGKFLLKNNWREPRDLALIARRWNTLEPELRQSNFTKLVRGLRDQAYPAAMSGSLVREASRWDVSPDKYSAYEPRYLASLSTPPMVSADKVWQVGNLKGYFLPRSDERGIFLGEHTNCCQHPSGVGAACAWFGQENARSGFFVVEDKAGSVVAQSWAWLADKGGLVFDSLESKSLGARSEPVAKIYEQAAADLSKVHGIVTLGTGTERLDVTRWPTAGENSLPLPEAYGQKYTDARQQVLLAKSDIKNSAAAIATSLNTDQSTVSLPDHAIGSVVLSTDRLKDLVGTTNHRSTNYVYRDSVASADPLRARPMVRTLQTDDDWQQATRIARAIYPEDYNYVSEGETTLLLDSPGRGVVGYATIDVSGHEINDLAVLPQFRPYSQTLMRGLYGYLKSVQSAPGEVWNASLRASTTDRLLNFYDRQGKIKILSRHPAEEMHGEPMYDVKFTVQ